MPAMFSRVHFSGWTPRLMAAFSAGRPEGVPADGVQDVEAAHALVARDHVGDAVVADVADVDVARRVGQHLQAVELGPRRVLRDLEGAGLGPALLPARLDLVEVVVGHGCPAGPAKPWMLARGPEVAGPRDGPQPASTGQIWREHRPVGVDERVDRGCGQARQERRGRRPSGPRPLPRPRSPRSRPGRSRPRGPTTTRPFAAPAATARHDVGQLGEPAARQVHARERVAAMGVEARGHEDELGVERAADRLHDRRGRRARIPRRRSPAAWAGSR